MRNWQWVPWEISCSPLTFPRQNTHKFWKLFQISWSSIGNICYDEHRCPRFDWTALQVVRTSFLGPRPRFYPPPGSHPHSKVFPHGLDEWSEDRNALKATEICALHPSATLNRKTGILFSPLECTELLFQEYDCLRFETGNLVTSLLEGCVIHCKLTPHGLTSKWRPWITKWAKKTPLKMRWGHKKN